MITTIAQRWRDGSARWRPSGEVIRTSDYEVANMPGDLEAKRFICQHHYSGTFPAARFRFGLYRRGALAGVAVFSVPMQPKVLAVFPGDSVELGRFVLLDEVPGNGETWFLGRAFELLRAEGLVGVVSFSDPMARWDAAGRKVFPGHIGTIYQAHNAVYRGRARARTLRLLPDGRVFSERALSKIRNGEQGWRYAIDQLVAAGASTPAGDLREWLAAELPRVTRQVRHPGNHRYEWLLPRRLRSAAAPGLPYPKFPQVAA